VRYPSIKTILKYNLTNGDRKLALAVRKVLDGRTRLQDQWGRDVPRHSSREDEEKLKALDMLLDTHGVEWLAFECLRSDYSGSGDGFYYHNTGDTYASTLVFYRRRWRVSSWGDMVEAHERKCAACRRLARM
jgi:hypothetical protein